MGFAVWAFVLILFLILREPVIEALPAWLLPSHESLTEVAHGRFPTSIPMSCSLTSCSLLSLLLTAALWRCHLSWNYFRSANPVTNLFPLYLGLIGSAFLSLGRQAFFFLEVNNVDSLVFLGLTLVGQPQVISLYRPFQTAVYFVHIAGFPRFYRRFLFFLWDFRYWFSQKNFFFFCFFSKGCSHSRDSPVVSAAGLHAAKAGYLVHALHGSFTPLFSCVLALSEGCS
jgi:hypothetical protein